MVVLLPPVPTHLLSPLPDMTLPSFLVEIVTSDFGKLIIVILLTLPIAYNREHMTHIMGLRTFPLVSMGTCGLILITQTFVNPGDTDAQARVVQGILSGIGFIGGGAILKRGDRVLGTASAATVWTTGALGIAVAYERFDIALYMAVVNYLILYFMTPLKERIHKGGGGEDPESAAQEETNLE